MRFNAKGTRLLCNYQSDSLSGHPLVYYDLSDTKNIMSYAGNILRKSGKVLLTADGYIIKKDLSSRKSACCFAGNDDEFVIGASDDNNIYIWSAPPPCQHQVQQFVEQPLHVLSEGHHYGDIRSVRYSAQSGLLACAGQGPVQLWSANARNN